MSYLIILSSLMILAQSVSAQSHSVKDGVYTKDQAKRGQAVYVDQCARCHGDNLGGGESAPELTGDVFVQRWKGLTVADLFDRIRQSMPSDNPGSITPRQASDLVSHILATNGFPAGQKELDRELPPLKEIRIETK